MEIRQRLELRRILAPQLQQSLKILTLPLLDLKDMVEAELNDNPFLEETPKQPSSESRRDTSSLPAMEDFRLEQITKKSSLQDVLLRQLGMFTNSDEAFRIGQ